MFKNVFFLLILVFFFTACGEDKNTADANLGQVYTRAQLEEMKNAQSKAFKKIKYIFKNNAHIKSDGKLVMVIFTIPNCIYCDELYEQMAKDKKLLELLKDDFSSYHILFSLDAKHRFFDEKNAIKALDLANRFEINATPTLVFFDQKGRELLIYAGMISAKRLKGTLEFLQQNSKLSEEEIAKKLKQYYLKKQI